MTPNPTDQKRSWVIALACCFINCLLYGVTRLSGLMLVATIESFQVTRASAAVPFSVSTSVRNISGVFVGYLGKKFGLPYLIGTGCFVASLGAGLCFFASDILWLTICWGVIFGVGCGIGTCLLPLAINQHFDKHRGKASGISYSGSYVGSFIFPPIVVMLLENYGLNGAFLVISSTLLNGIAVSQLFQTKTSNKLDKNHLKQKKLESKEFENCTKNICQKFLHHVEFTGAFLKTKELNKTQKRPSIYLIAADPLKDSDEMQPEYCLPSEIEIFANCIDDEENKDSVFEELSSKSNMNFLPKRYTQNLHFYSRNVHFKGKLNTEYKLSIAKLRQRMFANFFRRRYSFNSNLQKIQTDDVKLISFKNFNCILCSTVVNKLINAKSHLRNFRTNDFLLEENLKEEVYKKDGKNLAVLNQISTEIYSHTLVESVLEPHHTSVSTDISVSNSKNSGTSEVTSGCIGNCRWKISRQSHHRASLTPVGVPSLSKLCATELKSKNEHENPYNSDVESFIRTSRQNKFRKCCFGWFRLHVQPMFIIIATTMSLHTLVTVCMITIIEDFAKDLHVPENEVHYALMALSTADLLGALTMGIITDHGLISRCHFITLCFLGTGIFSIAMSFSQNLTMLLTLVAFFGIFETGVIITFPLLIAQFIEEKNQAVALASSNALSSPTVLLVPLIIGHFRDRVGCYCGVFYILGAISFICSSVWLVASFLFSKRNENQFASHVLCC